MSESNQTTTVASAVNQFEAALGVKVDGIEIDDGKAVINFADGETAPETAPEPTPETVDVSGLAWNELVAKAAELGVWDNQGRDELETAVAAAVDEAPAAVDEGADVPNDPAGLAAAVEVGDVELDDAKKAAADGDFKPTFFKALYGDCKSAKACDHGARNEGAHYCIGCQKTFAKPDPEAFGLTEGQAEAVPTIWKNQTDDLQGAIDLIKN